MPQVLGSATLETMTTAQNRAVLADAEERALRSAPAPVEEALRSDQGRDEPDETTGSYELEARGALRRGEREEELVIVRGRASARTGRSPAPSSGRDAVRPPSAAAGAGARTPAG